MKKGISHSADIKRNIRHVFWLFFTLFMLLVAYLIKFVVMDSEGIVENPANPRIALIATEVMRGQILDKNGVVLAASKQTNDGFVREYPYGKTFAHLVGYSGFGQSGVESKYNFALQKLNNEVLQRVNHIMNGESLTGESLVLTVDADLQQKVMEGLGNQKGAVVVLEPSTGKVLALASFPNFDPNDIGAQWDTLLNDEKNSPLLNRATQGLYPPGSIFKIITAAAAYESMPDYDSFTYECKGFEQFESKRIHCFDSKVHGTEDISHALSVSCNTFFSTVGLSIGGERLRSICDRLLFNTDYPCPLPYARTSFTLDEYSDETNIVETAIGQGKTLVSPMHMALITSAVANGGIMMAPYVVDHVQTNDGIIIDKYFPTPVGSMFTMEETEFLKNMMVSVVESGTGAPAHISGVSIAAKTGTAENSSGDDHGWFVAFAPADKPQVVVSIVLENSGGPRKAMGIAKDAIAHVLAQYTE